MSRIVAQFSCGAASAVATKLAIAEHGDRVVVLNAFLKNEHPDNRRFAADCERWFGIPLTVLRDERYGADVIQVFRQRDYIKDRRGAICTRILKRQLLDKWKRPGDVIVFGFTAEEADRLDDFRERNPDRPLPRAADRLPLVGHQREPRPISWAQQRLLLPKLPDHLARMALFDLNTGARDDVVCSLRWEWEIKVPELGVSVFEVPRGHVKGRKRTRLVVCNSVAQSVIESVRGQDPVHVFVYRRERAKNLDRTPAMPYRAIETMNNSGWQRARAAAGLGDLHIHDLRHTVGMRLREAGVGEGTISDILWHTTTTMTRHYSVAQIVELHAALEKIRDDSGRWNKSLATLKQEHLEAAGKLSPPEVPRQRKTA